MLSHTQKIKDTHTVEVLWEWRCRFSQSIWKNKHFCQKCHWKYEWGWVEQKHDVRSSSRAEVCLTCAILALYICARWMCGSCKVISAAFQLLKTSTSFSSLICIHIQNMAPFKCPLLHFSVAAAQTLFHDTIQRSWVQFPEKAWTACRTYSLNEL